ncbi:MAG: sortase [Candidatus Microsaccharimonas sossegonensis]|uniref:Sortase n=1 Tax=Candidatus Microsaccharimonas sossegonensis TaxID=2506948 RepID=A0A4Q0AHI8_9BACT|nr:MAG: sortase [Candidatus Microsaccharimonas sossegonensis]
MKPDNDNKNVDDSTSDVQPQSAGDTVAPQAHQSVDNLAQQKLAADVIRSQIGHLYDSSSGEVVTETPQQSDPNPYQRDHTPHPLPEAEQWKQYHTAWQNYYQQYYENYYAFQVAQPPALVVKDSDDIQTNNFFQHQSTETKREVTPESLSNSEALSELRQKLLGRVTDSAKKIRKSRHFIPIISAVVVVAAFVVIQYNQLITANVLAYVSPGSINPQNIIVDPTTDVAVTQESKLIIPKINVDVPVIYDVGTDNASQMAAMAKGVAQFPIPGANSHPGEIGNTVLAGHSSNDLFDKGDYKFIFAQLEKLTIGDSIYANYKGKRYTYIVTKMQVVAPTNVGALVYPTTKPVMTLVTCTPLGTSLNRLLVTAEQVSPDPSAAAPAPTVSNPAKNSTSFIPGDNGTLFSKLFTQLFGPK